jgi:hypothetical protein
LAQSRRLVAPSDVISAFPDFIRTLGKAACFAYLANIAELELACIRAVGAPDAAPLEKDALTGYARSTLGSRRVVLHPSVWLLRSRFPVVSVWEAVRQGTPVPLVDCGAECALVARPIREVEVRKLPPGAFTFLTLLLQGVEIGDAAERAAAAVPSFDIAAGLALLGDSRVVTALR